MARKRGKHMPVSVEKIPYGGWPNCYRVTNGRIELIATSDVGPRVIRLGFVGGCNEFAEFQGQMGLMGGNEWRSYGGHRLWHSPESRSRTYFPDNDPVAVEIVPQGIELTPNPETNCGVQKSLVLTMDPEKPRVLVEHHLKNVGVWEMEMAAWCLSVMAPGGVGFAPQAADTDEEGLLPNRVLALWQYTEMSDPRYSWGSGLIRLRQDATRPPTKVGMMVTAGWAGYANGSRLFLKQFAYDQDMPYPDGGCSVELYTDQHMLEVESLSPLQIVEPGETISQVEAWSLIDGFSLSAEDGEAIGQIEKWLE